MVKKCFFAIYSLFLWFLRWFCNDYFSTQVVINRFFILYLADILISIAVGIKHRYTIKFAIVFKLQIEKSYLVMYFYTLLLCVCGWAIKQNVTLFATDADGLLDL